MDLSFVGTAVWYVPGHEDTIACEPGHPLAATVARVLEGDRCNLLVLDLEGRSCTRANVPYLDQDEVGEKKMPPRSFFTQRPQKWVARENTALTARVEKLEAGLAAADATTCLADLAARLENVEAGLVEAVSRITPDVRITQHPTLEVETPAEPPPEYPEHPKRGKRH